MMTPVTASETYLQGGGGAGMRQRRRKRRISAFAGSHPFLKSTDQPVKNFGSLVKRRTANRTKKNEMEPSAKLEATGRR